MAPPIAKRPVDLMSRLRKTVTAHQAVQQGIATHVQKEHARRLDIEKQQRSEAALRNPGNLSRGKI